MTLEICSLLEKLKPWSWIKKSVFCTFSFKNMNYKLDSLIVMTKIGSYLMKIIFLRNRLNMILHFFSCFFGLILMTGTWTLKWTGWNSLKHSGILSLSLKNSKIILNEKGTDNSHKNQFSNHYIVAASCCRHLIWQTMNSAGSNTYNLALF